MILYRTNIQIIGRNDRFGRIVLGRHGLGSPKNEISQYVRH